MAYWTNLEVRRLKQARDESLDVLAAMFPRHSARAVHMRAIAEGRTTPSVKWLRLAHEYFERREAGQE